MENIYADIIKLIADERKKRGKPAIMVGWLLGKLISDIDDMLEYEPPEKKE